MNKVLSTLGAVILACMVCYADAPSKEEVANANAVVTDILAPKIEAMKSGKAKPNEVADYALSLMGEAETSAAKYALAGNAYAYYMKGGEYAKAAEAIGKMREAIPDIPADRLLKAISPAARSVSANKAPEVHAILADLQGKVKSQGEITKIKAQLKAAKVSERPLLYRKLGEGYAVIGDWKQALENLSKGDGEVVKVAQYEMGNEKSVGKLAGMWWDASEEKGIKPAVASAYRKHAAELYQKGLDDGSITGLNKTLAERRVAESAAIGLQNVAGKMSLGGVQLWENGPYWAECNVGARKPEEYGYCFWWGDTVGYMQAGSSWNAVDRSKNGFVFCGKNCPTWNKNNSQLRALGYIDSAGNLNAKHDAARKHMGAPWRMPTDLEFKDLHRNCSQDWVVRNGIPGLLLTGRGDYSSKSIFFPAPTGYGSCWSATVVIDNPKCACTIGFHKGYFGPRNYDPRNSALSIRPVRDVH